MKSKQRYSVDIDLWNDQSVTKTTTDSKTYVNIKQYGKIAQSLGFQWHLTNTLIFKTSILKSVLLRA